MNFGIQHADNGHDDFSGAFFPPPPQVNLSTNVVFIHRDHRQLDSFVVPDVREPLSDVQIGRKELSQEKEEV